jgi:hypothetical protein
MVTSHHESLHRLFRDHPGAIQKVFHASGFTSFPEAAHVRLLPNDLTEIRPLERRVDTAMEIESVDGSAFILAVESQGRVDEAKRLSWPYYVEYLRSYHGCPVVLVVLCQDPATAAWARAPIMHELPCWVTGAVYPLVLSPENVPPLKDVPPSELLLCVLSAVIHGKETDAADLERLAVSIKQLDPTTKVDLATYVLLGLASLPIAETWSTMMNVDYDTLRTSPIIRKWLDEHDRVLGAEAEAQGMAKAKAASILRILDKRSVGLSGLEMKRICTETDLALLDRWLDAALEVTSAEELFGRRPHVSDTP